MAILMPMLGKARYQARRIVCMSNIRQQSLIFFTYAQDYDGKFPEHMHTFPRWTKDIRGYIKPFSIFKDNYITDSQILICPILKKFGREFADTYYIHPGSHPTRVLGGWDSTITGTDTPPHVISMAYAWYANYVPCSPHDGPHSNLTFYNGEKPWPKNLTECSSSRILITHELTVRGNTNKLNDLSHGGSGFSIALNKSLDLSETIDNPIGFSDGSTIYQKNLKYVCEQLR